MTDLRSDQTGGATDDLERAVSGFADAAEAAGIELHGLMINSGGRTVARGWWAPYDAETPQHVYSMSKTFLATAFALARQEGLVDLADRIVDHWPEYAALAGPRASGWTFEHLLRMSAGHRTDVLLLARVTDGLQFDSDDDLVAWCLAQEPDAEPGSVFCYNQLCSYLVSATLQRIVGERLVDWLRPRLFDPLDVAPVGWQTDGLGRDLGFAGLHIPLRGLLGIGELWLRRGQLGGRRLVEPEWFELAVRPLSDTAVPDSFGQTPPPDWSRGYGYQVWMMDDGFRGDGAFGQYALVIPELDAVIAVNAAVLDMQAELDLIRTHLFPALARLAARGPEAVEPEPVELASRELPPVRSLVDADSPDGGLPGFTDSEGITHELLGRLPAPVGRLTPRRDGTDWLLDLQLESGSTTVPAGDGHWAAGTIDAGAPGQVAVRSSAGLTDEGFVADLIVINTPHRVRLVGDPASGRLRAAWNVTPLAGADLSTLVLPG